ncbi:MAG: adenine phosphoribosyltransferase [Planctomycetes bacterium]|nr:adenine phosphoribosyltransferase [Planctomycetota bacterium]
MDLAKFIRDVPDFPKPGILFKDITPLLNDPAAFAEAVGRMAAPFPRDSIDAVAAAEARGFLFAAPLALALQKPLVPLRKPGKLPYQTHSLQYDLEYGQAELQVHIDGLAPNARVLVVDDLLATGGTLAAACQLCEKAGGNVASCIVLIELAFLHGRDKLKPYRIHSVLQF